MLVFPFVIRFFFLLVSLILWVLTDALYAAPKLHVHTETKVIPLYIVTKGRCIKYKVEVADTENTRQKGLMFRKKLHKNEGMIFIFPTDQVATMWMKNTFLSLDVLYFTSEGNLTKIHHSTTPQSQNYYSSDELIRYALELNGGSAKKLDLAEGDHIYHEFLSQPQPPVICQKAQAP